ncbi:ribosome maturation factor RimM [Lachnospiraceae bacterium KK002]
MEDLFQVGVITTTHGIRGEVKVFPTTDDAARFKKLKKVLLDTGREKLELEIVQVKFFKNLVILKFKDIDNINDVEKYKGKSLFVTRDQAVKCEKDEYFIADLLGVRVLTEEGQALGQIADVLQTGANDVYVIQADETSSSAGRKKELLIPAIKECILDVDMEQRTMRIHLLPGLLEED